MGIEVKFAALNNSFHAKEPFQATPGSAGYDLFAAERKKFFAKSVNVVSTEPYRVLMKDILV